MTLSTRQIFFKYCDSKQGIPIGIEGASCFGYLGWLYSGGLLGADRVLLQVAMLVKGSCQLEAKVTSVHVLLKESIIFIFLRRLDSHDVHVCGCKHSAPFSCAYFFFIFSCKFMFFHGQGKIYF